MNPPILEKTEIDIGEGIEEGSVGGVASDEWSELLGLDSIFPISLEVRQTNTGLKLELQSREYVFQKKKKLKFNLS